MRPVLARHWPSTTLVWLASGTPALPSTPEEPTDDPHQRDVPHAVIHAPQQRCIWRSQRYRVLSDRYRNFSITVASLPCRRSMPADTGPSMVTRRTMRGSAVIIDGLVLRAAIVPDHHIACPPAPAHCVFQPRHVILRESGLQDFRRAHGIQV